VSETRTLTDDYDRNIHTNPDARAWARFFMETWRASAGQMSIDEETLHGWFANAMMAMHDHLAAWNGRRALDAAEDHTRLQPAHVRLEAALARVRDLEHKLAAALAASDSE
jgi:hypothetical protein